MLRVDKGTDITADNNLRVTGCYIFRPEDKFREVTASVVTPISSMAIHPCIGIQGVSAAGSSRQSIVAKQF